MKSFLPNDIKDQNRKIIFDILVQEPELAKVDVTERTTMSFVTVSKIIDYFEEIGIVQKSGGIQEDNGKLGRKRVMYRFNPNSYSTIGVQIVGGVCSAVLLNLYGQVIASYDVDRRVTFSYEDLSGLLVEIADYFTGLTSQMDSVIVGVGIGLDAAIHKRNKTLRMRTVDNQEEDYDYEEILGQVEQEIQLPIILENDVNASTIAEFRCLDKAGEGPDDLLQITLGEGIGAGLILNKKLHRGHNSGVGEMEYTCFDVDYQKSPSQVGWLESRLGLDYLKKTYHYSVSNPHEMGEKERTDSIDYISRYLGMAVSNIVSLLDITYVILSGKTITALSDGILAKTREYINQYTGWELELVVSSREDATAVGAAILELEIELGKIISGC